MTTVSKYITGVVSIITLLFLVPVSNDIIDDIATSGNLTAAETGLVNFIDILILLGIVVVGVNWLIGGVSGGHRGQSR